MTELSVINVIINFIVSIMFSCFNINCWYYSVKIKPKHKMLKIFFLILILATLVTIYIYIFPTTIKMLMTFITSILLCYLVITKDLKQSIILVMCSQLIIWLAECSFMIFAFLFNLQNIEDITTKQSIFLLLNTYIFVIAIILLKLKIPKKY